MRALRRSLYSTASIMGWGYAIAGGPAKLTARIFRVIIWRTFLRVMGGR